MPQLINRQGRPKAAVILFSVLLSVLLVYAAVMLRVVSLKKIGEHPDEKITRAVAINIWKGDLRNNWKYANVPPIFQVDCYNFSAYMYADALAAGPHAAQPLFRERLFSAILGSLAVVLFSLIALRFFGLKTALAALGVMAVFPLLVQDSHYARPEAFVTFVCAVAYLLMIPLLRSSRPWPSLAASSFCFGLLIATKISFIPLAVVPLICLVARKNVNWRAIGVWGLFVAAGCFVGVPDAFFHPQAFLHGVQMLRRQYAHEHPPHSLVNSPNCFPLLSLYFWQTLGPVCCLLGLTGIVGLLCQRRYLLLALFVAPLLFYLGSFSLQRTFFERNLSHVAPLMAILCGVGLVWLTDFLPGYLRNAAFTGILALMLIQPALISWKLVFVAMRTRLDVRAQPYTDALQKREQVPVESITMLLYPGDVDRLAALVKQSASDIVVPIDDCNDGYTLRMLRALRQQVKVREVGYFPSLFPQFSPNTILTYHSPNLRYIRLTAPDFYQFGGVSFASWRQVLGPFRTPAVKAVSWVRNGVDPGAKIPAVSDEFFGSYTPEDGDGNRGRIEIGPINVGQLTRIGVPIITGPSRHGLSVVIRDHATHRAIVQLNPPPNLALWAIWRIDLSPGENSQIDVIAQDDGSNWGQWLGIGLPVRLKNDAK